MLARGLVADVSDERTPHPGPQGHQNEEMSETAVLSGQHALPRIDNFIAVPAESISKPGCGTEVLEETHEFLINAVPCDAPFMMLSAIFVPPTTDWGIQDAKASAWLEAAEQQAGGLDLLALTTPDAYHQFHHSMIVVWVHKCKDSLNTKFGSYLKLAVVMRGMREDFERDWPSVVSMPSFAPHIPEGQAECDSVDEQQYRMMSRVFALMIPADAK